MPFRRDSDGSKGDADYGVIGEGYSHFRQPEPRIAAYINDALGSARQVLNVGAGAGSYEPVDRLVVAIEPSAAMRAQRPKHLPLAVDAVAEKIPFTDGYFDASMATFTIHQWSDLKAGIAEMRRVTRGPIIFLSCDPDLVRQFWLDEYAPEVLATEARRYPSISTVVSALGGKATVLPIPIPLNCKDGFNEAYYGRPERLLEDGARLACSAWSFVDRSLCDDYIQHLGRDLDEGIWDSKHGYLRNRPEYDGSLRLIIGEK
jgi:SAM-dependent methyltransferase